MLLILENVESDDDQEAIAVNRNGACGSRLVMGTACSKERNIQLRGLLNIAKGNIHRPILKPMLVC